MKKAQRVFTTALMTLFFIMCLYFLPISASQVSAQVSAQIPAQITENIPLISYHSHVPFVTNTDKGLTYDLAAYLTKKSRGRYIFRARVMSRPRVNNLIESSKIFVVPWVNPVWFKDKDETKFLWTQNVLLLGKNVVISRQDNKLIYKGPNSLSGLKFGGVRGHQYTGIDDFISQSVKTVRIDSDRHLSNIHKLLNGLIDVTSMPSSAANYFISELNLEQSLFIAPIPHKSYERKMLISSKRKDIRDFLDQAIRAMAEDPEWLVIIKNYKNDE
ncbi:MAG: transporter substrate-binding domain-containing protein [Halopseudomonas aestusnigri]